MDTNAGSDGSSGSLSDAPSAVSDGPALRATLAVEPDPEAECCLVQRFTEADVVNQNITVDIRGSGSLSDCGTCHANVIGNGENDGAAQFVSSDIGAHCICPVFHRVDCVPSIERVQGRTIIFSVLLPDRETLRRLVEGIRGTGATADIRRITPPSGKSNETVVLDVADITDKQRDALEEAMDVGYFEMPRQADLEELADRLGISKSAVSQRLKAVESKLVRRLMEQWSDRNHRARSNGRRSSG